MEPGVDESIDSGVDLAAVRDRPSPLGTLLVNRAEWTSEELERQVLRTERADERSKCQLLIDVMPNMFGKLHGGTVIPPGVLRMGWNLKRNIPPKPDRSDELLGVEIICES